MKKFTTFIAFAFACFTFTSAQSIVEIPFEQNPLFEVITENVNITYPEDGDNIELGADLIIKGGSGTYSYRWYTPAGVELGTQQLLTVDNTGQYLLDISDTCDCLITVEFNVTQAGVEAFTNDAFAVFPNPAKDYIEIIGLDVRQMTVTGLDGRVAAIYGDDYPFGGKIDIASLVPGTYVLTITDVTGKIYSTKLIKK